MERAGTQKIKLNTRPARTMTAEAKCDVHLVALNMHSGITCRRHIVVGNATLGAGPIYSYATEICSIGGRKVHEHVSGERQPEL